MAFFHLEAQAGQEPPIAEIVRAKVAFKLWVMVDPIVKGQWPVIGHLDPIPAKLAEQPWFVLEDQLTGELSLTKTGAEEVPPKPGQVDKLEMAAVWERDHIVDRLNDHFAGRPNSWAKSLRPEKK